MTGLVMKSQTRDYLSLAENALSCCLQRTLDFFEIIDSCSEDDILNFSQLRKHCFYNFKAYDAMVSPKSESYQEKIKFLLKNLEKVDSNLQISMMSQIQYLKNKIIQNRKEKKSLDKYISSQKEGSVHSQKEV